MRTVASALVAIGLLASSAQAAPTTAPGNLHVTGVTATHIMLAWDPPSDAGVTGASATAEPRPAATPPYLPGPAASLTLTSADLQHLVCGTTYTLSVNFYDGSGPGPVSSTVATTSQCTKPGPAPPANLMATPDAASVIHVDWDPPADPAVVNEIYRISGPLYRDDIPALTDPATTYDLSPLVCGQAYTFSIAWVNDEGLPSPFASTTARTADCSALGPPGAAPVGFHVTSTRAAGFVLAWAASATKVVGYRLAAPEANAETYVRGTATAGSLFFRTVCGHTYTLTLSWIYPDGRVSEPATTTGSTNGCPPAAAPPPTDTTPPVMTVRSKLLEVNAKRAFRVNLGCDSSEATCSGTLRLEPGKNGRRVRLPRVCARGVFDEIGGQRDTIRMVLTKRVFAKLVKARRLRFRLTIAATDLLGNSATSVVPIQLLAPPKRRT
jgi:hypothetical protein